jgi:hypothetical protein
MQHARIGKVGVAYQVVGDGRIDLVRAPASISNVQLGGTVRRWRGSTRGSLRSRG